MGFCAAPPILVLVLKLIILWPGRPGAFCSSALLILVTRLVIFLPWAPRGFFAAPQFSFSTRIDYFLARGAQRLYLNLNLNLNFIGASRSLPRNNLAFLPNLVLNHFRISAQLFMPGPPRACFNNKSAPLDRGVRGVENPKP